MVARRRLGPVHNKNKTRTRLKQSSQVALWVGIAIALLFFLNLGYSHIVLSSEPDNGSSSGQKLREEQRLNVDPIPLPPHQRFIVFDHDLEGQGTGNVISGLLAAHLIGDEFDRIVCIQNSYTAFLEAFRHANTTHKALCDALFRENTTISSLEPILLLNYLNTPPDECKLQEQFVSDERVVVIQGNTYPRWPPVPDRYFLRTYTPTSKLLHALPYQQPPTTVVHLRAPDMPDFDFREGLDNDSLRALAKLVPKAYLVTNRVKFYDAFRYWDHPNWGQVIHSANGLEWDSRREGTMDVSQNLQMWADWYAILMAETVYHTHSDFSISAVHWMNNRNSCSIGGMDGTTLKLTEESFWVDGETTPLVDRTKDAEGNSQLRSCGVKPPEDNLLQAEKRKDAFADDFA